MELSDKQKQEIAYYFEGSCNDASAYEDDEDMPLSEEAVLEVLVEQEIELCAHCGWWSHQSDMDLIDDEVVCSQCAEDL